MTVSQVLQHLNFDVQQYEPVSGGDINSCYKLVTANGYYFVKLNDENKFPGMFKSEAKGLSTLKDTNTFAVPGLVEEGVINGTQYLVIEWMQRSQQMNWIEAGRKLAMMHKNTNTYFGLDYNNYIGSLVQINARQYSWKSFFSECRILPVLERLYGALDIRDRDRALSLLSKTDDYFPQESASLLHGDLWSGNMMFSHAGPCIYDPAMYYGHREMDMGMTMLFGGFPDAFYDAYNEVYPLEKNWKQRIDIAQLYPLMVHAVLFGGSYVNSVKQILKKYAS